MNLYRTFQWFSGGLGWSPLSELWQVDGLARTYRDPSIPTLPLEDPPVGEIKRSPTIQQGPGPRSINPITVTNLLITTLAVLAAAAPFKARSEVVSPDHRQRAVVATQQHNLLTSTLAGVVDTTVKRDPLLAQQHRKRDVVDTTRGMPVQLRPVAAVALPPGKAFYVAPQPVRWLPSDESAGTPKTLYGDATRPANNGPSISVALPRALGDDTSQAQPPTLRAVVAPLPPGRTVQLAPQRPPYQQEALLHRPDVDASAQAPTPLPPGATIQIAPPLPRNVADTSRGTPSTLLPVVVAAMPPGRAVSLPPISSEWQATPLSWRPEGAPAVDTGPLPVGQQSSIAPPKLKWLPADESAGTPKPLYIDDQIPGSNLYEQVSAPDAKRVVVDTSQSSPRALLPVVVAAAPPGKASHVNVPERKWLPAEESQGIPKPLQPDATQPFVTSTIAPPDARRTLSDTSSDAWPLLASVAAPALPVGQSSRSDFMRVPLCPGDTSRGTPLPLWTAIPPAPPIVNAPPAGPVHAVFLTSDSTRGTPKTLTQDAQTPIGKASAVSTPCERRIPADTTAGTSAALLVPLPPVVNLPYPTPDAVRRVADTSQSAYALAHPLPPLPIGKVSYVAAPRFAWQVVDTSQSKAFQLGDGIPSIVTTPGPAGGGFRRPFHDYVRSRSPDTHRGSSPNTRRGRR